MKPTPNRNSGCRYPTEIISHAVWLHYRFALSYRDVEEVLAARSIVVSYVAVRQWCLTLGQQYANNLRQRRGNLGDTWHVDDFFVTINGACSNHPVRLNGFSLLMAQSLTLS